MKNISIAKLMLISRHAPSSDHDSGRHADFFQ